MQFVLDENVAVPKKILPDNVINFNTLFEIHELPSNGLSDSTLITLANKLNYVIITRDMQILMKQNKNGKDAVFAYGKRGTDYIPISKTMKFSSRQKIYSFAGKYLTKNGEDLGN